MNTTVIFRDQNGKICGSASHAENGEVISIDSSEYQEWLSSSNLASSWTRIRMSRDHLLKESDWTVLPDAPSKNKEAWLTYRQALRDIPSTFKTPEEVVWPEPPNK